MNRKRLSKLKKIKQARGAKGTRATRLRSSLAAGAVTLSMLASATPVLSYFPFTSSNGEINGNNSLHTSELSLAKELGESIPLSIGGEKINYNLPGVGSKSVQDYKRLSVGTPRGTLSEKGLYINDTVYLPVKRTVELLAPGVGVKYNGSTKTITLEGAGLYLTATEGGFVTYANDRPLFAFSPIVKMNDGNVYIPASSLCKALGLSYTLGNGTLTIRGSYSPLTPASRFYREDEVYWLSKIISAEASGEALLGQIAVGDVIMNRVKSNQYPSTIYGVIFDKKYGVQFSPTADGRIYGTPTYTATLAAKICLEGTSLSDNAIFFLNPRAAQSNWIVKNRPYAYTIGNHDFYL